MKLILCHTTRVGGRADFLGKAWVLRLRQNRYDLSNMSVGVPIGPQEGLKVEEGSVTEQPRRRGR